MENRIPSAVAVEGERAANSLRGIADGKTEDRKLREAAADFEAVFYSMMLTQMRKAVPKSGLFDGGQGEQVFQGLLDQEYTKQAALNGEGLGIGRMVYEALRRPSAMDVRA
ncbi:MAG: rod-binding protein [Planctomycetota bacterium]